MQNQSCDKRVHNKIHSPNDQLKKSGLYDGLVKGNSLQPCLPT